MELLIVLIFGSLCALLAHQKGRSSIGWFFIGVFFNLLGLIILLCLSNLREEQDFRRRQDRENRRLREQVRQERAKGEAFRQHAARRLDRHDDKLGLDTRDGQPMLPDGTPAPSLETGEDAPHSPPPKLRRARARTTRQWHYMQEGVEVGPVAEEELVGMLKTAQLAPSTLVWSEGMAEWVETRRISALQRLVRRGNPPA